MEAPPPSYQQAMQDPLDFLTNDDLDETLQLVADRCGIEVVRELIRKMEGEQLSIPRLKTRRMLCERYIAAMYQDHSVRKIARRLGSSTEFVRGYIRQIEYKKRL